MNVVKPTARKPVARKRKAPKPPADKLTPGVCEDCERDVLRGWTGPAPVRIEPQFVDPAVEPALWSLGQPTYSVHRDGAKVTLWMRTPSPDTPPVEEVAIAHVCDAASLWMHRTARCPQWFGFSPYVVALMEGTYRVLAADDVEMTYKEVLVCSDQEAAHNAAQMLAWRRRGRDLR